MVILAAASSFLQHMVAPHQQDALNTPEFKADIDRTVNLAAEQLAPAAGL